MLKISGVILCIGGCVGYGLMRVGEWKRYLSILNQWIVIIQKIRSRLVYQKETLEESCIRIGEKEEGEWGTVLQSIGKQARVNRKREFGVIWKDEIEKWCSQEWIGKKMKELLKGFPEYVKGADEELQMNLLSLYLEELQREKSYLEKEIQEKQKPILAISIIGGLMISILLV